MLFSILYGFWIKSYVTFDGDATRRLAAQFLEVAQNQRATVPLVIGHRLMGISLTCAGELVEGRTHFDCALALYDTDQHRPLSTPLLFLDNRVAIFSNRAWALWALGSVDTAVADADRALKEAGETEQAVTLMYALCHASAIYIQCGNYGRADAVIKELIALSGQKETATWKVYGFLMQGCLLASSGKPTDAVHIISSRETERQSRGSTQWAPFFATFLAIAYLKLSQFDTARRCICEAMTTVQTTKERWCEAELNRIAGEIALNSPEPNAAKAQAYFERALAVARQQRAKSWNSAPQ